jgi:hypothetical protein
MVMTPIRGNISSDAGYALPYAPGAVAAANQLHGDIVALWNGVVLAGALTGTADVMVATLVPARPP